MQWHNYGYQGLAAETSAPFAPYHLDTPLSFVWHLCIWYGMRGHDRGEANKQSTDSMHGATGDSYPAHNRPIVRQSLVLILRSREIPSLDREKSSSLVNIPKLDLTTNVQHMPIYGN